MEAALATWLKTCAVLLVVTGGLSLPLVDILTHPDSIAVLPSLQVDATTYDALGDSIAVTGDVRDIPARQPPGFVVLLALLYRGFGHSWLNAKLGLWVALVGSTVLAARLAHRVWGSGAGVIAALLTATSPALRHYVGTIQYEVVAALGLLSLLILSVRVVEASRPPVILAVAACAGLAGGLLALTREVFVGVLPLVCLWIGTRLRSRIGFRKALLSSITFLSIAATPIACWSVAQSRAHGQAIFITDKGLATFALGNNPETSGTYNVDRIVEPSGLAFFSQMPWAATKLVVRKALYFWGVLRDGWNVPRPAAWWVYRASGGLVPVEIALPLARGGWVWVGVRMGVVALFRRGSLGSWWILPAIVIAVLTAHVITLSSHRFAVPILPIVFVMISGPAVTGFYHVLRRMSSQRWHALAAGAAVAVAAGLQWVPLRLNVRYQASSLDAMNEFNRVDPILGQSVRFVEAAGGRRTAMILPDEFLPAGDLRLTISARRGHSQAAADVPVARVTVIARDVACAEDIPLGILYEDRFSDVWIPCPLKSEGPATLLVETLGVVELAFENVTLTWQSGKRQPR